VFCSWYRYGLLRDETWATMTKIQLLIGDAACTHSPFVVVVLLLPSNEGGYVFTFVCVRLSVCLSARLLKKLYINFISPSTG